MYKLNLFLKRFTVSENFRRDANLSQERYAPLRTFPQNLALDLSDCNQKNMDFC